jgi:hypothetical protein
MASRVRRLRRRLGHVAVSLLDKGPDIVTVYPDTVETSDEYGNRILGPAPTGVQVRGRFQPSTADESAALGQQAFTMYRFTCREFPSGPYGRVAFDGSDWDIVGEPKQHRGSSTTRHVTVWLKER